MDGKQALIGAAGAALVLGEYWFGPDRMTFNNGALGDGQPGEAHKVVKKLALEGGFVLGAVLIAGVSDAAANGVLALLAILAILWFMHRQPVAATGTPGIGVTLKKAS